MLGFILMQVGEQMVKETNERGQVGGKEGDMERYLRNYLHQVVYKL